VARRPASQPPDVPAALRPHVGRPFAFLLDAADGSRPAYAGSEPSEQLIVERDGTVRRWAGTAWETLAGDPIAHVGEFVDGAIDSACDEAAGASVPARTVGYLSYELGCRIEGIPPVPCDPVGAPLAVLSTYTGVHVENPLGSEPQRIEFSDRARRKSHVPVPRGRIRLTPTGDAGAPETARDHTAYRRGFERIASAIAAGEIYQANLTRAIRLPFEGDALSCFLRLSARQRVAHGAYLDLDAFQIVSNSPECFLRIDGDRIETFPIKGTRARTQAEHRDAASAAELRADPKELAEHVMIVDLERNDLGRVCIAGSVEVPTHAEVMSLATVHHLVSRVVGRLRDEVATADVLRATFPGGSITGAPKIQAMRTIHAVEPVARGVYTGAIGGFHGARRCELAIAIRTAVVADGWVSYGTGGGIVADSRVDREYEETVTKARAFLDSLAETDIVDTAAGGA
jgi:para-aminobenzoate synthetase component 1